MEKIEHIEKVSIPDEDMKGWMDTLREGGFSEEEMSSMMVYLNQTFRNIQGPSMVEGEIQKIKEALVNERKYHLNEDQEKELRNFFYRKMGIEKND